MERKRPNKAGYWWYKTAFSGETLIAEVDEDLEIEICSGHDISIDIFENTVDFERWLCQAIPPRIIPGEVVGHE